MKNNIMLLILSITVVTACNSKQEKHQAPDQIAAAFRKYIKANYPAQHIKACEKITKENGRITYEIQVTGKELVFDSIGNFIEEELD